MRSLIKLERKLQLVTLFVALVSIPVILMQSSNNKTLHNTGDLLGIAIWLFFVIEITILLRIHPNNWQWMNEHKFECFIVIAASPFLTLMGENEMVFSATPLIVIPRFLKILKFAKIIKIGKLLKSAKIVNKSEFVPDWGVSSIQILVAFFIIGILGTVVNKKSKSLIQGYEHWIDITRNQIQFDTKAFLATLGTLATAYLIVRRSKSRKLSIPLDD